MHDHHNHKRFSPEKIDRLENPRRQQIQPAHKLVDWIVSQKPSSVLDVGPGIGYVLIPLAQALPDARMVGLDVEPEMLKILSDREREAGLAGRMELIALAGDAEELWPLEEGKLDLVVAMNLYHELDDRARFLEQVVRVLSPDGRLVLCDGSLDRPSEEGPPRDHLLPMEQIVSELEAAGLKTRESLALYDHFYTLVCS